MTKLNPNMTGYPELDDPAERRSYVSNYGAAGLLKRAVDVAGKMHTSDTQAAAIRRRHAFLEGIYNEVRADGLKASEARTLKPFEELLAQMDERAIELADEADRDKRAADARAQYANTGSGSGWSVGSEPTVYQRGNQQGPSFFADLAANRFNQAPEATQRLQRNNQEARAMGSYTSGAGDSFAPPGWMVDEFVKAARPKRITADLLTKKNLPAGISSVNLPKVTTGTQTLVQATQNATLSGPDMATAAVSASICTIAGFTVVSQQLLDQAGTPLDEVILQDLAADYAAKLDTQVLIGAGSSGQLRGIFGTSGIGSVAYTSGSPTVQGIYPKLAGAINTIQTTRFANPTVWVMHPRRWNWFLTAVDTSGRPLVVPNSNGDMNAMGIQDTVNAQGMVGTLMGLPVYVDLEFVSNYGAGTNEDKILLLKQDDLYLWESNGGAPVLQAFDQTKSDTLSVMFRAYGYSALIPDRYPASICTIGGTGLVAPTF